jgi:hypothetical protein
MVEFPFSNLFGIRGSEETMEKRMLSRSIVSVGVLVFFSLAALAQNSKDGVITINGGRTAVYMKPPSQVSTPAIPSDSKLVKIYSNLGMGKSVYNPSVGNGIIGPKAGQKFPEWIGCGFRPKADHTVTEIQVGVTYVQGTNGVTLSLNADNQDRPGKALHTWQFANLPDFGTCCTLQTGKLTTGIKVKRGKLYWVVLRTSAKTQDTWDVWNYDINGQQGPWSNNIGSGWSKGATQQLNAFGVFGQ